MKEYYLAIIGGIISAGLLLLRWLLNRQGDRKELPKMKFHNVFKILDGLILRSDTFKVKDYGKQMALRYVLRRALQIFDEEMKALADQIDDCKSNDCTTDNRMRHIVNLNNDCINNALEKIGALAEQEKDEADRVVLRIIVEKLHDHIAQKIDTLLNSITDVASIEAIGDCRVKQYLIFTIYGAIIATMYIDLQAVSDDINGDLDGMLFKGELIGI